MVERSIEIEFNELMKLSNNLLKLNDPEIDMTSRNNKSLLDDGLTEVIGDADSFAKAQRFKEVKLEVGHIWLQVESDVQTPVDILENDSVCNLQKDLELVLVANDVIDGILSKIFFPHILKCNSSDDKIKRSFGIHDLHNIIWNKNNNNENTSIENLSTQDVQKAIVDLTKSNLVNKNTNEKESTTTLNENYSYKFEKNVNDKSTEMKEHTIKDQAKNNKTKYFKNIKKWFGFNGC